MAQVAADKTEMEEEVEAKLSDSALDGAQRTDKKELTSLRRQRGLKKSAVTRIRKVLEGEISRQANSRCHRENEHTAGRKLLLI